jgi:hypothetical protein
MATCRCPKCGYVFTAKSSDFGQRFDCPSCRHSAELEVDHVARFDLPERIHIEIQEEDGSQWAGPPMPVLLRRGYWLPPLRTDENGRLDVTREMIERAEQDEVSTGLMDHRGNYAMVPQMEMHVPSMAEGLTMAAERRVNGPAFRAEPNGSG